MNRTTPHAERWLEPDKRDLSLAVTETLKAAFPLVRARAAADGGLGLDRTELQRACGAGAYAPLGHGATLARACVVAEQWGRALAPEPFVETNVVLDTLRRSGSTAPFESLSANLLSGREIVAWAANDLPGFWGRDAAVRVRTAEPGPVLIGTASAVAHAADADWLLVAARDGEAISQVLVSTKAPGLRMQLREGLDLTRPRYEVTFDNVPIPASAWVGSRGTAAPDLQRQVCIAIPLAVSQTIGAMQQLVERAVAYAKARIAFGRPIGSFQAVKQLLVDASLGLEMSAGMCDAAADAVDADRPDAAEIVSMTKAFVSRTSLDVAHAVWQVLGGVAYMWDDDFHLYLRRITADAAFLGSEDWHNERIWALHNPGARQEVGP